MCVVGRERRQKEADSLKMAVALSFSICSGRCQSGRPAWRQSLAGTFLETASATFLEDSIVITVAFLLS